MQLPDWFMNYGNRPGYVPPQPPVPRASTGSSLPDWLLRFGNDPNYKPNPFGALQGPNPQSTYGGLVAPRSAAPADVTGSVPAPVGSPTGGLFDAPLPPTRPSQASLAAYNSPPVKPPVPLPPMRPYDLGGLGGTPPAPAESAPESLPGDASNSDYWANEARRSGGDTIGPGHWMDPGKIGSMVHPNSIVGKLLAMRNPKPGPGVSTPQQPQGILPSLLGGLFGNSGANYDNSYRNGGVIDMNTQN